LLLLFFEILLVVCTVSTVKTTIIEKTIVAIEKRTMYSNHMIITFCYRINILYNSSISLSNKTSKTQQNNCELPIIINNIPYINNLSSNIAMKPGIPNIPINKAVTSFTPIYTPVNCPK